MENILVKQKDKPKRIWEIDFLRGLAIILMILDHLCYDLSFLPSIFSNFHTINNPAIDFLVYNIGGIYWSEAREVLHLIFLSLFLLLVGISCHFSKSNLKRGISLFIVQLIFGGVMELVSFIIDMNMTVWFGILFHISVGILLTCLIDLIFSKIKKVTKWVYLGLGITLIVISIVFDLFIPTKSTNQITFDNIFMVLFGGLFYGGDYFCLTSTLPFIFIGKFLGEVLYKERKSLLPSLDICLNKPFCFVGRHSILFYLFHQVFLFLILGITMLSLGYTLNF